MCQLTYIHIPTDIDRNILISILLSTPVKFVICYYILFVNRLRNVKSTAFKYNALDNESMHPLTRGHVS